MIRCITRVLLFSTLVGCGTAPTLHENRVASPLLDGQELFGETIPAAQEVDILGVSPEMAQFVSANGRTTAVDWLRMKRLINGMADAGYLDLKYDGDSDVHSGGSVPHTEPATACRSPTSSSHWRANRGSTRVIRSSTCRRSGTRPMVG